MNHSDIRFKETFFVHVDGIMYSEHNYFADAMKTAKNAANIFPSSHTSRVVSSHEPGKLPRQRSIELAL
jgi:hypothetical protein